MTTEEDYDKIIDYTKNMSYDDSIKYLKSIRDRVMYAELVLDKKIAEIQFEIKKNNILVNNLIKKKNKLDIPYVSPAYAD